jgi:hypothetical protein
MKLSIRGLLLLPAVLLLSACLPEERIWWSPQGDRALVSIADALHLVTADGELGEPLLGGPQLQHSLVKSVTWLPDGSGFVCQRQRTCKTWAETRALIPEGEASTVEQLAPAALPLLQAAASLTGHAKTIDDVFSALPLRDSKQFAAAVLLAYEKDPAALEELLMKLPEGKQTIDGLRGEDTGFEVSELCLIKLENGKAVEAKSWNQSLLRPSLIPKVSPKHDVVACITLDEATDTATLEVLPLEGGPGLVVSQHASGAFDWMPDGRTLVFMAPLGQKEEKVQSIHRVTVVDEHGALLKPNSADTGAEGMQDPVTLATGIMLNRPVVQALPDGRVLFASQPATLPIAGAVAELNPHLYVISADGKIVQVVPTSPGDLPTDLGYFVASPDGKLVAVVESETDAVAVVELASGKTRIVSPPHPNWQCETLPAWKSATELTFAALHGASAEPKWMSWSEADGVRCISGQWPAAATESWLKHKKPDPHEAAKDATGESTR